MTPISEHQWKALALDEQFFRALPPGLREFVLTPLTQLFSLKHPREAFDFSDRVQPSAEFGATDESYLQFLRVQIELKPRGENWNTVLKTRLKILEANKSAFFRIGFHSSEYDYCSVWMDGQDRIFHWEIYFGGCISIPGQTLHLNGPAGV